MQKILLLVFNTLILFSTPFLRAEEEICIGQIVNNFGEMHKYAAAITVGIEAAIQEINQAGGIKGKKLKLLSYNDNGNPLRAQEAANELKIRGAKFFLGCMGTRSIVGLIPDIEAGNITMLFPWSNSKELRNPSLSHMINGPGLLQPQINMITDHICNKLKLKRIGIIHADDPFSEEGKHYAEQDLDKLGLKAVSTQSYSRQQFVFKKAAQALFEAAPKAVMCISTSMPAVKIIKNFLSNGNYTTAFFGIDSTFMTGDILQETNFPFYYTAVVPNPRSSSLAIAKEYLRSLRKSAPAALPNVLSFTYYISTRLLIEALQHSLEPIEVIHYLEKLQNYSLGGFTVDFDKTTRHLFGSRIFLIKD